jgi:hypothetical protein
MRLLVVSAFAAALLVAGAASAGTIDAVVANTLTSTDASGVTTTYLFNGDGSYTVTLPDGSGGSGAWRVSGSQFCFTPAGVEEICVAAPPEGKGPGDSWPAAAPDGSPLTVSIIAGR